MAARLAYETKYELDKEEATRLEAKVALKQYLLQNEANKAIKQQVCARLPVPRLFVAVTVCHNDAYAPALLWVCVLFACSMSAQRKHSHAQSMEVLNLGCSVS